jgi:hypothetical protein
MTLLMFYIKRVARDALINLVIPVFARWLLWRLEGVLWRMEVSLCFKPPEFEPEHRYFPSIALLQLPTKCNHCVVPNDNDSIRYLRYSKLSWPPRGGGKRAAAHQC